MRTTVIDMEQAKILRFARRVGLELEAISGADGIKIYAFELTTGIEFTDLPGMAVDGYWPSWDATLSGLQRYLDEAMTAGSTGAPVADAEQSARVYQLSEVPAPRTQRGAG